MEYVIVERDHETPISKEAMRERLASPDPCLELWRVEHVVTLHSRDGRRSICVFRAPDAAAVRSAIEQSEAAPFQRIYTSEWITIDD